MQNGIYIETKKKGTCIESEKREIRQSVNQPKAALKRRERTQNTTKQTQESRIGRTSLKFFKKRARDVGIHRKGTKKHTSRHQGVKRNTGRSSKRPIKTTPTLTCRKNSW